MDAADIKREILRDYDKPQYRRKVIPGVEGLRNEDKEEMGNALEQMTQTKGWLIVESWIIRNANPQHILQLTDERQRGFVEGEMGIMQKVKAMIAERDDIVANRRKEEEAKKEETHE